MRGFIFVSLLVVVVVAKPPQTTQRHSRQHNKNLSPRTVDQTIKTAMEHSAWKKSKVHDTDDTMLVEMDMKMSRERYERTYGKSTIDTHKGLRDEAYRWTNNIIPYEIDEYFEEWEKVAIRDGLDEWEKYTCLKLVPRTTEENYIRVFSGNGCWSWVGMEGGLQELSLDVYGCIYHHTIVHEFGHAVGFHHEQTRPDRDDYVRILLENIQPGQEYNFEKYDWVLINDFGVKYDYWSIMHYSQYAFSATGGKTIETLEEDYADVIGSVPGLSFKDIQMANIMYKCDDGCTNECPAKAIHNKDCKCWCNTGNPGNPTVEWDGVSECMGGDDFNETCIDYYDECAEWASQGECAANANYMLTNCRKSCKICGEDAICQDFSEDCEYWSIIGECAANPGWMNQNCRKSCKICDDGGVDPGECEDTSTLCAEAAAAGDCEAYAYAMLWTCPVSCKACPDSCEVCGPDRECRNWDILCPTWQKMGECEKNPDWMERFCPRACKECEGGTVPDCKNYQNDGDCDYWAGIGECATNPGWMLYKCTKSCRLCGDKAVCLDREPGCSKWADEGQCETNPIGMDFSCAASCELCVDDSGNTKDCKSYDFNCEMWETWGECDKNPSFMLYYCPRHCRVCGPNPVCKNYHELCDQWASEGECDSNPGYMHLHCKKACKLCDDGSTDPTGGPSTTTAPPGKCSHWPIPDDECIDYRDECPDRAAAGECESDPTEMWRICRKTCRMCGEDALCLNDNASCEMWAETGQCETNPSFMHVHCREACKCCT